MKSKSGEVLSTSEHQCGAPDEARLEVKKSLQKAKKRAREEETQISRIYNQELGELHNKGFDFVTEIPAQATTKRTLQRQRCKSQGNQTEPENREDVVLDEDLLKMNDGSSFLLADDNSLGERILIFSGNIGREGLNNCEDFLMDGTFKSSSKQFSQIYSIHADFGSSEEETNIYPVAFALLPDKKKETYVKLFRLIIQAIPNWKPKKVNVDFEAAAIMALQEVFPAAQIQGCYFHLKKCLWRKVQELGLTRDYKENEEVRTVIKMCASLAFLKPEDVVDGWLEIYSQNPGNPKLIEFFDYFTERWLENEQISIQLWNCYKRRHRTTNAVEGWNNKVNSTFQKPRPRVKDLVQTLKMEAENSAVIYMRMQLNLDGKRRKLKYKKLDKSIEKTIKLYEETGNIRQCLRTLSYLQKLE